MTATTTPLTLDAFRELAARFPTLKVDIGFRVNPKPSWAWSTGEEKIDLFAARPTPAFYYLSPSHSHSPDRAAFSKEFPSVVFLDPLVGALLRDAGYVASYQRARSLRRTAEDLDAEVKKHLPETLAEIGETERARLIALGRQEARKAIRGAALGFLSTLAYLGPTADVTAPDAEEAVRSLTTILNDARDKDEAETD